jgi:hypothetical protein
VHGQRYDLSTLIYNGSAFDVLPKCTHHGEFSIRASTFLEGQGCRDCAGGFTRTRFIEACNNEDARLYIIKCSNYDEEFYKIGITKNQLKTRFPSGIMMPYGFEVIKEFKDSAEKVWDLEKKLHRKFKQFKYTPSIYFGGFTECFSTYLLVEEVINISLKTLA